MSVGDWFDCGSGRVSARISALSLLALLALGLAEPAAAQIIVNKSFSPANIAPTGTSTLTVEILNNTTTVANSVAVTDNLPTSPTGLVVASGSVLSNTCGGTVTATIGSTSASLTGGSVPASVAGTAGRCSFSVQVTGNPPSNPASYLNTIPIANTSSSIGPAGASASATLSISAVTAIAGTKSFTPGNLHGNGAASRMRIQLNNANGFALTNVGFTDTFPTSMQLASVPNVSSSCGGAVTAVASGLTLALGGGTIPASGNCFIEADMVARDPNTVPLDSSVTNSIATNGVTSAQGARNASAISGAVRIQKAATVAKAFSPAGIQAGGSSTLTLTLRNFNATAISGFNFSDTMPAGVTVVGPAATSCGGTANFTATTLGVTGGTLAAAPTGIGSTSCTITAPVTAAANGNYVNSVPAGNLAGINFSSATATLQVSSVSGTKAFSPTSMPRSGVSTLTITLQNRDTINPATITSFTDALTTMGAGLVVASTPAATTTCGGTLTATVGTTSITLTGGTIPRAASAVAPGSCTITVPVLVGVTTATGTRTNTVAVNGLQTSLGNNTAAFTANLSVTNPIAVTKSFAPSPAVTGTVTRLTVTITRPANAALFTSLSVTDPLPSGFTIAPTPAASTTCSSGSVSATPGATSVSLSGASLGTTVTSAASCNFQVNILTPTAIGTSTNTIPIGNATATTSVGTVSNTSAGSAAINVVNGVTVNKSFSPISIVPAGTSRLTVYINNPASIGVNLTGVTLLDTLPVGLAVMAPPNATFTASGGSCTGTINAIPGAGTLGITAGAITAGSVCELNVDVTTNAIGSLTNTLNPGAITSAQGQSNVNTASVTLVSSGNADVAVTKTDGVTSVLAGTSVTYTIGIVNNSGALAVAGLPVVDNEPAEASFTGWTCTASAGSSCAAASGNGPVASSVTLAPLGTASYQVTALIDPDTAATSVVNSVSVDPAAAGVLDNVPGNNSASDTDTITRSADVKVTKAISNSFPAVGSLVTFTIVATNDGPSTARDVSVADMLPSGYSLFSATPSIGSFVAPDWTIGDLAPATSATLAIEATVNPTGPYANTATVASTTPDPLNANNSATIAPATVGLRLEKTTSIVSDPVNGTVNPKAIPGAVIEYRIRVSNEGSAPIDADTIVIQDILPPVDSFVATGSGPPIQFADGSVSSGLTYSYASDVSWSSQPGGGAPFSYVPVADGAGYDSAPTGIRINPKGIMAAGALATPSSFEIVYRARVR